MKCYNITDAGVQSLSGLVSLQECSQTLLRHNGLIANARAVSIRDRQLNSRFSEVDMHVGAENQVLDDSFYILDL